MFSKPISLRTLEGQFVSECPDEPEETTAWRAEPRDGERRRMTRANCREAGRRVRRRPPTERRAP